MLDAGLHLLDQFGFAAQAVDLGPAGDPGLDLVTRQVVVDHLGILFVVGNRVRARPDDRHLALQHVEELGQLVEAVTPQEPAQAGHPEVVPRRLLGAVGVGRIGDHRAELVDGDQVVVEPVALLPEQHRAGTVEFHQQRDRRQHRDDEEQDQSRQHAILDRLDDDAPTRKRRLPDLEQRQPGEMADTPVVQVESDGVGAQMDRRRHRPELVHAIDHARLVGPRQRDDDLVDPVVADEIGDVRDRTQNLIALDLGGHARAAVVEQAEEPRPRFGVVDQVTDQPTPGLAGADDHQVAGQPSPPLPVVKMYQQQRADHDQPAETEDEPQPHPDAREVFRGLGEIAERHQDQEHHRQGDRQLVHLRGEFERRLEHIDLRGVQHIGDEDHADHGHYHVRERRLEVPVPKPIGEPRRQPHDSHVGQPQHAEHDRRRAEPVGNS